jgi:DHA2 family methylenomycin A resistance protein-like MFS transporter
MSQGSVVLELTDDPATGSRAVRPSTPRAAALAVAMLGFFAVALDAQIVNVALPDIGSSLGGGLSGLQWVVTGLHADVLSLLLFAGTLSDRIGAKRAYGMGMAVFVVASAACASRPRWAFSSRHAWRKASAPP